MNRLPAWAVTLVTTLVRDRVSREGLLGDLEERATRRTGQRRLGGQFWLTKEVLASLARYALNRKGRSVEASGLLDNTFRDLRFGLRILKRRPAFAGTAVATLSLGIGAVTSIYTVVDAVLLRSLPFEHPSELVAVWQARPSYRNLAVRRATWNKYPLSFPQYRQWRERAKLLSGVAVHTATEGVLLGGGRPEKVSVGIGSASLLYVLGVKPMLGRWFLPGEDGPGAQSLMVLSCEFWTDRFGADPKVLGRTLRLDDRSFEVIGVLPSDFEVRRSATRGGEDLGDQVLWIPVGAGGMDLSEDQSRYEGLARLAPGVSMAQARAETQSLLDYQVGSLAVETRFESLREVENRDAKAPLLVLLGATCLLLLIACANTALLILGEADGRRHEMATRVALGAGRRRVVGQLLVEGATLGVLGGIGGLFLARGGVAALVRLAPPMPRLDTVTLDHSALAVSIGLGFLCGCMFGLVPLVGIGRLDGGAASRERSASSTGHHRRFQEGVVVLEIALTVLLTGAGALLVRSYSALSHVDVGFVPRGLAVAHLALPTSQYGESVGRVDVMERLRASVARIPDVSSVSLARRVPFLDRAGGNAIRVEGRSLQPGERWPMAVWNAVDPGFHATMGIPVLSGRALATTDGPEGPGVMVVSETMARAIWPGQSALGEYVIWSDRRWEVVGVVGDALHGSLGSQPQPTFYVPIVQDPPEEMSIVVRTARNPSAVLSPFQDAVRAVDPDILLEPVGTMTFRIRESLGTERFRTLLMGLFAVVASILALVGVFGVTARAVGRRTRELGIRMALGEARTEVLKRVVVSSLGAVGVGILLGLALILPAYRGFRGHFYQTGSSDLLVLGVDVVILAGTALLATYLAGHRVAAIDPATMLRSE